MTKAPHHRGALAFSASNFSLSFCLGRQRRSRHTFSRGEGGSKYALMAYFEPDVECGRRIWNQQMLRLADGLPIWKPKKLCTSLHYRPRSTSVTKMGSEAPIFVPASPREKLRALPRQCNSPINPNLFPKKLQTAKIPIYFSGKMVYDVPEQSRRPRVKCHWDGELPGGRRKFLRWGHRTRCVI